MLVTNGDVWQAVGPLGKLCAEPWPVKTAYRLAKLARKLSEHHRDIDQVRVGLIKQHGEETNGEFRMNPESPTWDTFAGAFNELMAEETEIDWGPVELPNNGGISLKPEILIPLMPFVTVEGE